MFILQLYSQSEERLTELMIISALDITSSSYKNAAFKQLFILPEYFKSQKFAFHFLYQGLYDEFLAAVENSSYWQ